jgi:hypothetical protein
MPITPLSPSTISTTRSCDRYDCGESPRQQRSITYEADFAFHRAQYATYVLCNGPKNALSALLLMTQTRAAFSHKSYAGLLHGTLTSRWGDWKQERWRTQ